jgi:hypothetical protein
MCDQLKKKLDEWREWLLGDDLHSIRNQIHTMIWDSAVYQSINEARAFAATDDKGQLQLNGMVHQFIDRCFFDTQMMAIRRLLDKETRPGERSVTSLWRLLDDMEKHVSMLTREHILDALGLPYEYEKTLGDIRERDCFTGSVKPMVMGKDAWVCKKSEYAHKCIDAFAGVRASQRSPGDAVRVAVIQWLKGRLQECKRIHKYVDKFLAHSATPESRVGLMDEETKITLGQILAAHKVICQIAEFIVQNLSLGSIGNPLRTCVFDQFEHFEKSWATDETLTRLQEWWHGYYVSTHQWLKWDWQNEYVAHGASTGG